MLVVECGEEHRAEREYIVAVLLGEFLGLEFEIRWRAGAEVVISSTDAGDHRRVRVADVLFASSESLLDPGALPRTPLQRCPAGAAPGALLLGEIPVIYGKELAGGGYVAHDGDEVRLGVDVFGGAFAQLSLLEEAVSAERDAHDRFPAEASLAVREGFAARPVVDECVELLWWGLSRLWPRLSRRSHAFVVRPTHDVDWPFYSRGRPIESVRDAVRDTVVRHDRSLARARISALFAVLRAGRNADPCNTFDFLMAESESRGLASAFYFIAGRTDRARDPGYPLDDVWIRSLLRRIDEHGHEIGLHPSYGTLRAREALRAEREALTRVLRAEGIDREVAAGRQHFLRFENPTTWADWDHVGLRHDSTVGFASLCGFRAGTCREYPVFDLAARRQLQLRERPLVAMETALLSYQGTSLDALVEEFRSLRETCRRFDGTFTFLWHNNRLVTPAEREAYAAVL